MPDYFPPSFFKNLRDEALPGAGEKQEEFLEGHGERMARVDDAIAAASPGQLTAEEAEALLFAATSLLDAIERLDAAKRTNYRPALLSATAKLRSVAASGGGRPDENG